MFHGANSLGWQECLGCNADALEALAGEAAEPWRSPVHASHGGGVSDENGNPTMGVLGEDNGNAHGDV